MSGVLYSEKKIAIFNGIIALMERGINPYSIKVSDIAQAADVGKGTIYDYFTSKEEAISQAILYKIDNEVEAAYSRIKKKKGFKEKFYEGLHIIAECMDDKMSTLRMLLSLGGLQEFYEYLREYKCDLSNHLLKIHELFDHLLEIGIEEGIIVDKVGDTYYRNMVISSVIIGFTQYFHQINFNSEVNIEDAMEAAYRLLIKALN